jgi:general secretion pathway protein K
MPLNRSTHQQGVVLLVVLFFALLLTSSIATFTRRAIIDASVARNRDAAARAEALARSGIRLGKSVLVMDQIQEETTQQAIDSHKDAWSQLSEVEIPGGAGATLTIQIEDSGMLLNLNSIFDYAEGGAAYAETEPFLDAFFEKVIDEMKIPPGEKELYKIPELRDALMDWVDADTVRLNGGLEDTHYQLRQPPYRAANGPLMSVDDLFLIEGFDRQLVEALQPYITVEPFVGVGGVNLNTAPAHVLSLIYSNDGIDDRLASEDQVKQILEIRQKAGLLCGESLSLRGCTPIRSIVPNPIFPPPTYTASVFTIVANAQVGDVKRSIEAVVNRSVDPPLMLSWETR